MSDNSRTQKVFKTLASFSEEVLVFCPHCKSKAYVFTNLNKNMIPHSHGMGKSTFRCNNCYTPIDEKKWYGPVIISPINRNCGFCGNSFEAEKRLVRKSQQKMKIRCSTCGQEKFYEVRNSATYANNNQATDPNFGLDLWLQFAVDSNTF